MSKSCTWKRSKKRIAFDKTAVVENCKIKNTHTEQYVAGTDVVKGAVGKGTAEEAFIWNVYVWE